MFNTEKKLQIRAHIKNDKPVAKRKLYDFKSIRFALLISIFYLMVSSLLVGFKTDQLLLIAFFNVLYFASSGTRKFIAGFSVFIIYWIIFDYMKAFPNYRYNTVHIASVYHLEKAWFGIPYQHTIVTPNEYFAMHHTPVDDVIAGMSYLCWVPVPLLFAIILFFKNKRYYIYFSLTFLLVNLIGFLGYYLYPAAPPWYVQQYGFIFHAATPGNTAGMARFDSLVHVPIFKSIYSKSSNVFAAIPSLHAAYMLIVLYFGIKAGMKSFNILFALIMLGIWFAAVYSGHHYILDVLLGISCAVVGILLFQWFIKKTRAGKKTINYLLKMIS